MDDLISKLQEILGSEEGMQKVQNVANMLGIGNEGTTSGSEQKSDSSGGFDLSALSGLLSSGGNSANTQSSENKLAQTGGMDLGGIDINTIMKIQQVMSAFHNEDDNTRFLQALRPLMREDRRHKVDELLRLMKLFSLLPLLKESGILDGFFKYYSGIFYTVNSRRCYIFVCKCFCCFIVKVCTF